VHLCLHLNDVVCLCLFLDLCGPFSLNFAELLLECLLLGCSQLQVWIVGFSSDCSLGLHRHVFHCLSVFGVDVRDCLIDRVLLDLSRLEVGVVRLSSHGHLCLHLNDVVSLLHGLLMLRLHGSCVPGPNVLFLLIDRCLLGCSRFEVGVVGLSSHGHLCLHLNDVIRLGLGLLVSELLLLLGDKTLVSSAIGRLLVSFRDQLIPRK